MSNKDTSLTLRTKEGDQLTKNELALQLARSRYDSMTIAGQLSSSLIGYNIIPIRLLQIFSYCLFADAFVALAAGGNPLLGVSLAAAVPLFIFYVAMEFVVKGINREFVVRSKFRDQEIERLALPGVYHEELTKLIAAELLPEINEQVVKLKLEFGKLDYDCKVLRNAYRHLFKSPDLNDENRELLSRLRDNMRLISRARSKLLNDIRSIKQSRDVEKSDLQFVAILGKLRDMQRILQGKESVLHLGDNLPNRVDGIRSEITSLETRLDAKLKKGD